MNIKKSPQKKYAAGSWLGNTGMAAGAAGSQMQGSPSQNLVSQAGPWGAIIGTASKIGTGIGDAIGGDAGGAVKGMFDPAAITFNKDLSTGKRIIGSVLPMLGGMWANKAAEKKKKEAEIAAGIQMSKDVAVNNFQNEVPQQQYESTFANGGMIRSYRGEMPNVTMRQDGGAIRQRSYTKEELDAQGIQGYTINGALAEYKKRHGLQAITYNPKDSTVSSNIGDKGELMTVQSSPKIWEDLSEEMLRGQVNGYGTPPDPDSIRKLTQYKPAINYSKNKFEKGAKANGGGINQSSGLPNVTMYKNGGTHQQNPLGGVPLGKTGNSVEEGEVRVGDYIFSARF